jgi:hypothetical protein
VPEHEHVLESEYEYVLEYGYEYVCEDVHARGVPVRWRTWQKPWGGTGRPGQYDVGPLSGGEIAETPGGWETETVKTG